MKISSPIEAQRRLVDFGSRHSRKIAVLSAFGGLGIVSALLDLGTDSRDSRAIDSWTLPPIKEVSLASDVDMMLANPFFGGEPVIAKSEPAETIEKGPSDKWRLMGIVTEGNTKHVVIFNVTAGKIVTAQLGETLPGGEELISIGDNDIKIQDMNESKTLSLFAEEKN